MRSFILVISILSAPLALANNVEKAQIDCGQALIDNSADEAWLSRQQQATLSQAMSALPPRLERILREYYFNDKSQEEIAAFFEMSEGRINVLRNQALEMLKRSVLRIDRRAYEDVRLSAPPPAPRAYRDPTYRRQLAVDKAARKQAELDRIQQDQWREQQTLQAIELRKRWIEKVLLNSEFATAIQILDTPSARMSRAEIFGRQYPQFLIRHFPLRNMPRQWWEVRTLADRLINAPRRAFDFGSSTSDSDMEAMQIKLDQFTNTWRIFLEVYGAALKIQSEIPADASDQVIANANYRIYEKLSEIMRIPTKYRMGPNPPSWRLNKVLRRLSSRR